MISTNSSVGSAQSEDVEDLLADREHAAHLMALAKKLLRLPQDKMVVNYIDHALTELERNKPAQL